MLFSCCSILIIIIIWKFFNIYTHVINYKYKYTNMELFFNDAKIKQQNIIQKTKKPIKLTMLVQK